MMEDNVIEAVRNNVLGTLPRGQRLGDCGGPSGSS